MQSETKLPLTPQDLKAWHQDGFLVIKDVIPRHEIDDLLKGVDEVLSIHQSTQSDLKNTEHVHGKEYFNIHKALEYTDSLDYLLDHPKVFDITTFLMGPYIQVMSCHIFIRHPSTTTSPIGKFHTDGGPALQRILPNQHNLPLQFKAQFFLTDMEEEDSSNFALIPGSHLKNVPYHHPFCFVPECNKYIEQGMMPPDAIQLKVKAGDVLIHPWSLWHAVAPNKSENTRKSISIRYGQMWFKTYHNEMSKNILERMTPRQRRLLGDFGDIETGDVVYRPPNDQVPLMLGDKAKDYGWSLDWMSDEQ